MSGTASTEDGSTPISQLPWQTIPRFVPGSTDMTEYTKKVEFLQRVWPPEHLALLAPRMALLCEGTAFKKVSILDPAKLRASDGGGVALIVRTLGGNWGMSQTETRFDTFEKAIYMTTQKPDETHESYIARHDVQFEELKALNVSLEEFRAYILLRQSGLPAEDRKKIIIESGGKLEYDRMCSAIRLLGSRVFGELQGAKATARTKTYDANYVDAPAEPDAPGEGAFVAHHGSYVDDGDYDIDDSLLETLVAQEDADAMVVSSFEGELESFCQAKVEGQASLQRILARTGRQIQGLPRPDFLQGVLKGQERCLCQRGSVAEDCEIALPPLWHWRAECPKAQATPAAAPVTCQLEWPKCPKCLRPMRSSMSSLRSPCMCVAGLRSCPMLMTLQDLPRPERCLRQQFPRPTHVPNSLCRQSWRFWTQAQASVSWEMISCAGSCWK